MKKSKKITKKTKQLMKKSKNAAEINFPAHLQNPDLWKQTNNFVIRPTVFNFSPATTICVLLNLALESY